MQETITALLWYPDVLEEHLDESSFLLEQWHRAQTSPVQSFRFLKEQLEPRLFAHLDALSAGDAQTNAVCWDVFTSDSELSRVITAALALLLEGRSFQRIIDFTQTSSAVKAFRGLQEAVVIFPYPERLPAELQNIGTTEEERLVASWERMGLRDRDVYKVHIDEFMRAESPVRLAAMRLGMAWGKTSSWNLCWALASAGHFAATNLLAPFVSSTKLNELMGTSLSMAAGLSGRIEAMDACFGRLNEKDELTTKLAFEAFCVLTGLDGTNPRWRRAPEEKSLLSLEADLSTPLEDAVVELLPLPNLETVRDWWAKHRSQFSLGVRYLRGKPYSQSAVAVELESGPLRWRQALADEVFIRSKGNWCSPRLRLGPQSSGGVPNMEWMSAFV